MIEFLASIKFVLVFIFINYSAGAVVQVEQGLLNGTSFISRENKNYWGFFGVPYAKSPVRFQLSEKPLRWDGVRDATRFGSKCVQRELVLGNERLGNENCLFLNVYSRNLEGEFPVLVFLHGGAFASGSSNDFGAKFFMDEDVVLVTINYRVSVFGFLNTGDGEVEPNVGLKDQVLALQWIQKNIRQFGGDPNLVTLFGASAGAASVDLHILSPMSKGLFSKAILQSGAAMNPWAFSENPAPAAFQLGKALGCPTSNSKVLVNCLRQEDAINIINEDLSKWYVDPLVPFGPSLDIPGKSSQLFLPQPPSVILKSGNYNKMPISFLICSDEGLLLHSMAVLQSKNLTRDLNEDWLRVAPITLDYESSPKEVQNSVSETVRQYYFGDKPIGQSTFENLTNLYSDRFFLHGVYESLRMHAKNGVKIFNGVLSYKGEVSTSTLLGEKTIVGVTHGDERIYLFDNSHFPEFKRGSTSETVSISLVKLWTNFAKYGDPGDTWDRTKWNQLMNKEVPYTGVSWFNLNFPAKTLKDPYFERMEFWDNIVEKFTKSNNHSNKEEL